MVEQAETQLDLDEDRACGLADPRTHRHCRSGRVERARRGICARTGKIEYPRMTGWETSDELLLTLAAGAGMLAEVEIGSSFPDVFEFEDIQPAPAKSYATTSGQRLVFDLDAAPAKREIIMHVRAMRPSFTTGLDMQIW